MIIVADRQTLSATEIYVYLSVTVQ